MVTHPLDPGVSSRTAPAVTARITACRIRHIPPPTLRIVLRVNVVVPVHNESSALPLLLDRLRDMHAAAATDVVIVDGMSTDGTASALRSSGLPYAAAPRGRASQMNAGAALGDGEIILFLHADTELPAGALKSIRAAIDDGASGGFFRLRLNSVRPLLGLIGRMITIRSRLTGIATGDQAMFVRRDVFDHLGGFPPLPLFEDVQFSAQLRRTGRVARLNDTVVTSARRWEQCGPVRTILKMWLLRAAHALGMSPLTLARFYEASR
ncbi:MAG: glycosyltransferase [Acidobacteria bacterium]|nr:glycosyltransferase [Acidobacteriota bacterium]